MTLSLDYRPTSLEEVFGNDDLVEALEKMIKRKKPRSSYLFTGIPGGGKTTMARVLANELEVHNNDFHEYNAANTRGIDTIRTIVSESNSLPLFGKRKMYLLDECHQITGAAAESLLKFLEEPPRHVYIVLCTSEPDRINGNTLSAIKRRCFCGELKTVIPPEVRTYLKAICSSESASVSPKVLKEISLACKGSNGHALSMLDTVLLSKDPNKALSLIDKIYISDRTVKPIITTLLDTRMSGPAKWETIRKLLGSFTGNPEDARRSIAKYFSKVIQGKKLDATRNVALMSTNFTDSFNEAGMLGLTLACRQACADDDVVF